MNWPLRCCALLVLLVASGCPPAPNLALVDAGLVEVDGGEKDAGVPMVPAMRRSLIVVSVDGGANEFELGTDAGLPPLEPVVALTLATNLALDDVRVRLFDWTDAVVPSDDTLEVSDGGFSYRLAPSSMLRRGRSYVLVVDPELGGQFKDSAGRAYDEWRTPFTIAGSIEPTPPASGPKRKKKR